MVGRGWYRQVGGCECGVEDIAYFLKWEDRYKMGLVWAHFEMGGAISFTNMVDSDICRKNEKWRNLSGFVGYHQANVSVLK